MNAQPLFDTVFVAIVAALTIQGIKSMFSLSDTGAKIVTVLVGAFFFAANGILQIVVTDPAQVAMLQTIVAALLMVLKVFVPSGIYVTVKSLFRPEV